MPQFSKRSYQAELMDDLNLNSEDLRKNLDELEIINAWLGGNQVVLDAFRFLKKKGEIQPKKPIRVADLGSGGGDLLRAIVQWSRKHQLHFSLEGIDANAFMIEYATQKAQNFPEIRFVQSDIFATDFELTSYDWVLCSLFCHHFTDEQLVLLFEKLNHESKRGFIINDLHRHWLAYYAIKWLTWVFRGSYLVQNDAPLSVLRAFRKNELKNLLEKAGVRQYRIRWKWAFRFQVIVWK